MIVYWRLKIMKLKALLLGSAAALIAVSGAHAADAVDAEPEPVDHVRVCDMYGAGFFYIPGTETCLKINGFVRAQYNYSDDDVTTPAVFRDPVYNEGEDEVDGTAYVLGEDGHPIEVEGTREPINDGDEPVLVTPERTDSSSTGTSTITANVNFDARQETDVGTLRTYIRLESDYNGAGIGLNDAYIELGGFGVGIRESRVVLAALPGLLFDGDAPGGGDNYYAEYTFAANGFSVRGGIMLGDDIEQQEDVDPFLRVDYAGDMFNIGVSAAQDTEASETFYSIYGNVMPVEGLNIQGYYGDSSGANRFSEVGISDDTQHYGVGAWYGWDDYEIGAGWYHREDDDVDGFSVGFDWQMTSDLELRLGYQTFDGDLEDGEDYRIRLQRSF
jgi:hypothetical protein